MKAILVYDKPMCCSTGVCGPEVDPVLPRFAADLEWLKSQGHEVRRFNLAQDPTPFMDNPLVKQVIDHTGGDSLPIVVVDDKVVSQGSYPTRQQLAEWTGTGQPMEAGREPTVSTTQQRPIFDEKISELVALGASVAANCEPCFKYHFRRATELGVHVDDMAQAVNVALQVKERPAQMMLRLTRELLLPQSAEVSGGCCGGASNDCR
jgi:AhpD family alkylhydroperoxidase